MGAIIYEGNFMVRGQFSSGAIVWAAIFLGGNCPRTDLLKYLNFYIIGIIDYG